MPRTITAQSSATTIDAPPEAIQYRDPDYQGLEAALDRRAAAGANPSELGALIAKEYSRRNRAIKDPGIHRLDPSSVADDYLYPRKDLNRFAVENWIRRVFLGGLKPRIVGSSLVFGLGRLFSTYNDLGAQHATDVDLNIIVDDALPARLYAELGGRLGDLRVELHQRFGILLDLHPDYTLLRESAVLGALSADDETRRFQTALFYRTNERSIRIMSDHPAIRERVFGPLRRLPDSAMFEHFLGLGSGKPTFTKIRSDAAPLPIGLDGSCDKVEVTSVIGSRAFGLYCRRRFPLGLFVSPPEWYFSMKYFVNRVYDYVCAMRVHGHSLAAIGFDAPRAVDGVDPDYRFLRNAHKLMLHLQELIRTRVGAYGVEVDYSWMSATRFKRLVDIDGDGFRRDFDAMVLDGGLLMPSEAERYRVLRGRVLAKSGDRVMEGRAQDLASLPEGLRYETIYQDADRFKIRIPYSWSDLAFFAFSAIGSRMARIVEGRLMKALPALGMPPADARRYQLVMHEQARRR